MALSGRALFDCGIGYALAMPRVALLIALALTPYLGAQPNIIVLFSDDQRADTIHAWGNENIETPNLDRLADEGFSFRNNYCMGGAIGAVCVPSRAMLHTGKAYFRIPMDMAGHPMLGETLGKRGYATFGTGKWHNGQESWKRNFQQGRNIYFGGMGDHTKLSLSELGADGELHESPPNRKFSSEIFADTIIDFLEAYEDDKPFYAYAAFMAPHDPRTPPKRYRDSYYAKELPLPANFMPQHPFNNGALIIRDEELSAWPRTPEVVRDHLAEYYGLITHLDVQIGRILEALEKTGKADDTYVVFAGDHGLAIGSHGLLGKQNVYEHSMKTPLIIKGPGVPAGGSSNALTYLFDIFPTLMGLAGEKSPDVADGRNLEPIWTGRERNIRDSLFLAYGQVMRSVRDERYKLIRYPRVNINQLFDLENDPEEMHSLAAAPEQQGRVSRMMTLLGEWQSNLGDGLALTTADPEPAEIDLTGRERSPDPWQPMWIIEKYFPDWF
jgi:arylsulfatase A-like enzyme